MKRKRKYFKIGDLIIYSFFIIFFTGLGLKIMNLSQERASKVEIYVDSELKYVYPLQKEERDIFVDTNIGGVNVKFKDNMVRVTSSNSPLKLNVKQGWIKDPGEVIIGSKVEIYVDSELKYVYPLQKEERDIFVDTNIGGVNVKFKDNMVRVTSSNSPLKLNVKQGWIKDPGEVIIGVPDRLLIKIVGDKGDNTDSDDIDFIVR